MFEEKAERDWTGEKDEVSLTTGGQRRGGREARGKLWPHPRARLISLSLEEAKCS